MVLNIHLVVQFTFLFLIFIFAPPTPTAVWHNIWHPMVIKGHRNYCHASHVHEKKNIYLVAKKAVGAVADADGGAAPWLCRKTEGKKSSLLRQKICHKTFKMSFTSHKAQQQQQQQKNTATQPYVSISLWGNIDCRVGGNGVFLLCSGASYTNTLHLLWTFLSWWDGCFFNTFFLHLERVAFEERNLHHARRDPKVETLEKFVKLYKKYIKK